VPDTFPDPDELAEGVLVDELHQRSDRGAHNREQRGMPPTRPPP